jgi:DNA invertase Pin-like site-specific DNA recombinase
MVEQRGRPSASTLRIQKSPIGWFADPGVSGRDASDSRPCFAAMLAHCAEHGVATIVLESASRFSRDLLIQESGFAMLRKQGTTLIAADDPDAFTSDTPTAVMVRQILGAVSEFEKNGLVAKLKGARDRRSAVAGKRIEGRKGYDDTAPGLVSAAKALRACQQRTCLAFACWCEIISRGWF